MICTLLALNIQNGILCEFGSRFQLIFRITCLFFLYCIGLNNIRDIIANKFWSNSAKFEPNSIFQLL